MLKKNHPFAIFTNSANVPKITKIYLSYCSFLTGWVHKILEYQGLVPDPLFNFQCGKDTFVKTKTDLDDMPKDGLTFFWKVMFNDFMHSSHNGFSTQYKTSDDNVNKILGIDTSKETTEVTKG